MGRYYSGQISGKFWFGIQESTDASFFGSDYKEILIYKACFCQIYDNDSLMNKSYCTNCYDSYEEHMADIQANEDESTNEIWLVSDAEIAYEFHESDLAYVQTKIAELEQLVGEHMHTYQIVDNDSIEYSYDMPGGIRGDEIAYVARLCLGKQIEYCLQKYGTCAFSAEL